MMETAIGILARTPGRTLADERADDCAAALSSGVVDSVTRIRCAPKRFETQKDHEFLMRSFQPEEQLAFRADSEMPPSGSHFGFKRTPTFRQALHKLYPHRPAIALARTTSAAQRAKRSFRKRVMATLYSSSARCSEGFCGLVNACAAPL